MSDHGDDPKRDDELTPAPAGDDDDAFDANERTVFDAEMLDRLQAIPDDDGDEEEHIDAIDDQTSENISADEADLTSSSEALQGATNPTNVEGLSPSEMPSQVSALQDIGDLVEPIDREEVDEPSRDDLEPSSSLESLMRDSIGDETKEAPSDLDPKAIDHAAGKATKPAIITEPQPVLEAESGLERTSDLTPAQSDHSDQSDKTADHTIDLDKEEHLPTGADLWDEASEPGDRSLSPAPAINSDHVAEATAALIVDPMPDTGDVDLLVAEDNAGEDRTDRQTAPELVRLECTSEHPALEVGTRALVLGRSSGCDVPIADPTMSRRHCNIWLREGEVWVEDLGSGNGTWINDVRIAEPTLLAPSDHLRLGQNVVFKMPQAQAPDDDDDEPATRMIATVEEPLLGPQGGHSTTYAHAIPGGWKSSWRQYVPLVAASLIFIVGASVFFVRQSRAQARQTQLSAATKSFFEGIEQMRAGAFKEAGINFERVAKLDPKHPRLPLYRKTVQRLARQNALLDEAETAIKEERLKDAAATVMTMDPAPELAERLKSLNQRIDASRHSKGIAAAKTALEAGQIAQAERAIAELKAAGLDGASMEQLETALDAQRKKDNPAKPSAQRRRKPPTDTGPLRRVHLALRQGRVEEAFRINRDLAASGIRQAEQLENTGNLGELRDVIRHAESAAGRKDSDQILKSTDHGLKLIRRISPHASGTKSLLNRLRANGYYFRAAQAAANEDVCAARKFLLKVKRLHRRHPKVMNGLAKTQALAERELGKAKAELEKGYGLSDVRPKLKIVLCTSSRSSKAYKEAKKLLKGR